MAVIKAKPEKIVNFFLPLVERESVMSMLVTRVADNFFNGAQGDTVTMRVGGLRTNARDYEWRTRTAPIVLDDIQGGDGIPVKLDTHVYSATALTDEQMTLDDINFAAEVLKPQADAVADRLEGKVFAGLAAAPFKRSTPFTAGTADRDGDPYRVLVEANRLMDADTVAPANGRVWIVGADVRAAILDSERFRTYNESGSELTAGALRDARIGRVAGTDIYAPRFADIPADFSLLIHRSALVLGSVAPVAPRGVTASARGSQNGFGYRWIADYDPNFLRDRSIVSSFIGVTSVNDERILTGANKGDLVADDAARKNVRGVRIPFTAAA